MTHALTTEHAHVDIQLIDTEDYENWLAKQEPLTKNWLSTQNYKGKGTATIPTKDGGTAFIIYGISNHDDMFIAGDLPLQLPKQIYRLNLSHYSDSTPSKNKQSVLLRFAVSWGLACYKFDRYSTSNKEAKSELPLLSLDDQSYKEASSYVEGIYLVRDLVNTPAGDLMPEHLAQVCETLCKRFDGTFSQIVGDELLEQNHPTIHAVGRASIHAPRLLDFSWGPEDAPKVTLIGKGVCFDSGGLDLKPSQFMRQMKKDMGGAAHVIGLAHMIMSQQLPIRLRVLIPAVENAVSSNAFRPGDVITTRKGLTVEIDNTDAEGRLVLCDALALADDDKPELIIDFATLTGACRVALGTELPGMFSNDDEVASNILDSGKQIADPVWQLPLHSPYQDMLKSDVADTLNSAASGHGGAITAALYLQLFVSEETPWVHFDVMAWNNRKLPGRPVGGEAMGVRAVFDYLKSRYTP